MHLANANKNAKGTRGFVCKTQTFPCLGLIGPSWLLARELFLHGMRLFLEDQQQNATPIRVIKLVRIVRTLRIFKTATGMELGSLGQLSGQEKSCNLIVIIYITFFSNAQGVMLEIWICICR